MFKSCGLKPSALSEVSYELSAVTLEAERKRGDVEVYFCPIGRVKRQRSR